MDEHGPRVISYGKLDNGDSAEVEDPAWGMVKYLRVKFRAGGKIQRAEVKEGET